MRREIKIINSFFLHHFTIAVHLLDAQGETKSNLLGELAGQRSGVL